MSAQELAHVTVLLHEAVDALAVKPDGVYVDGTFGRGGHSRLILSKLGANGRLVVFDKDPQAIAVARQLAEADKRVQVVHGGFSGFQVALKGLGIEAVDGALFDLGVSSPQIDDAERGFSFRYDAPLDMRMDRRQALTAEQVVNTYSQGELERIIRDYGEERPNIARRYAAAIIKARPLATTEDLASAILRAHVGRRQRTHPATRTFQAIRIFVNDELEQVRAIMPLLPELLSQGGRVGVISFHSLEDRIVKQYFAEQAKNGYEAELRIITKHPVDGATKDVHNPRSRSAKLRVAVKI